MNVEFSSASTGDIAKTSAVARQLGSDTKALYYVHYGDRSLDRMPTRARIAASAFTDLLRLASGYRIFDGTAVDFAGQVASAGEGLLGFDLHAGFYANADEIVEERPTLSTSEKLRAGFIWSRVSNEQLGEKTSSTLRVLDELGDYQPRAVTWHSNVVEKMGDSFRRELKSRKAAVLVEPTHFHSAELDEYVSMARAFGDNSGIVLPTDHLGSEITAEELFGNSRFVESILAVHIDPTQVNAAFEHRDDRMKDIFIALRDGVNGHLREDVVFVWEPRKLTDGRRTASELARRTSKEITIFEQLNSSS